MLSAMFYSALKVTAVSGHVKVVDRKNPAFKFPDGITQAKSIGPYYFRLGIKHIWVYAESCGLILAFLGSGGRNAATIFSLRYSSSR